MAHGEKTEQPTEKKRRRVREEGQVARSLDLGAAIALAVAILVFRLTGRSMATVMLQSVEHALGSTADLARSDITAAVVASQYTLWLGTITKVLLPLPLAIMASGMVVAAAQVGLTIETKALAPRWERLNPANGFKRLFSRRSLAEGVKGALKVLIFGAVVYFTLKGHAGALASLASMSPFGSVQLIASLALTTAIRVAGAMLVLGAADYGYQRWEFERDLRMTRQELKEDIKQSEGDPQARGRFRRVRQRFISSGITTEMPQATMVVTNPTHIAVALKYLEATDAAPRVVAKGQHGIAEEIVRVARLYDIPVIQNIEVARALYKQAPLGEEIPGDLYRAVAEILAVVYRLRERKRRARARGRWQQSGAAPGGTG